MEVATIPHPLESAMDFFGTGRRYAKLGAMQYSISSDDAITMTIVFELKRQ